MTRGDKKSYASNAIKNIYKIIYKAIYRIYLQYVQLASPIDASVSCLLSEYRQDTSGQSKSGGLSHIRCDKKCIKKTHTLQLI